MSTRPALSRFAPTIAGDKGAFGVAGSLAIAGAALDEGGDGAVAVVSYA
jgi:hypothetical protein